MAKEHMHYDPITETWYEAMHSKVNLLASIYCPWPAQQRLYNKENERTSLELKG
jgi:hypothetical protein